MNEFHRCAENTNRFVLICKDSQKERWQICVETSDDWPNIYYDINVCLFCGERFSVV